MAKRTAKSTSRKNRNNPRVMGRSSRREMDTPILALVKTQSPRLQQPQTNPGLTRNGGLNSQSHQSLHAQVCSQVDPFCPHAIGAKVAGSNTGAFTSTIQERAFLTVTTDANGNAGYLLSNSLSASYATVTFTGAAVSAVSAPILYTLASSLGGTSSAAQYRCTSWGFKYSYTGSDYTNQGVKFAGRIPTENMVDVSAQLIGAGTSLLTYAPDTSVTRLPETLVYLGRPSSQMDHEAWLPVSTVEYDEQLPWGGVVWLQVTGAQASTQVGLIEVVLNYEVQVQFTGTNIVTPLAKTQNPITPPSEYVSNIAGRLRAGLNLFFENLPLERVSYLVAQKASQLLGRTAVKMLM